MDYEQTVQLTDYGKLFGISRRAIINDDLPAFSAIPRSLAAAAARLEADKVFEVLTSGTTAAMSDGDALFHANHSNYVASGSGGSPSVTTVSAARAAMAKQKACRETLASAFVQLISLFPWRWKIPPMCCGPLSMIRLARR